MTALAVDRRDRLRNTIAIGLASLAGLLLEVAYTRIFSYKLWYYYTYLVIGLALLGIGSGGILMSVVARLQRASTQWIVAACSLWGSVSVALGYVAIAWLRIDTVQIWDYGSVGSFNNLLKLGFLSFALFASFIALGIMVSALLGRAGTSVGRLYCVDLLGAGLACIAAIPLISRIGPPTVVMISALLFAVLGLWNLPRPLTLASRFHSLLGAAVTLALVALVLHNAWIPLVHPEASKIDVGSTAAHSEWGPVFRVDAQPLPNATWLLVHDGTFGAAMHAFDGDATRLTRYDTDPRRIPFAVLGGPPDRQLIIGSAGGNEILASLHFGAKAIEAVELNPVTVSLLRDHFADETGRLAERPEVDLHEGDGRTYLARSDRDYDLVWYVAPDSYAANNAASSGAFVLSESYLYTSEMIVESLEHLTDDGLVVVQFGELKFEERPNRTARYIVTARDALSKLGVANPSAHILVAVEQSRGSLANIVLKRTPFTPDEVERFIDGVKMLENTRLVYAPNRFSDGSRVAALASGREEGVREIIERYPGEIDAVRDDRPFFWHFNNFRSVLGDITRSVDVRDPEDAIGERVLLLLLAVATFYAGVFLFAPFLFVRRAWRALPGKHVSALYFACLGLGFMFFEITMIQRLVRFLGYPTYSLTVTLAAILLSTGAGALASRRFASQPATALRALLFVLAVLTLAYRFGLDALTDALQGQGLGVRVMVAVAALVPLGLCLGMFMPLGLGVVSSIGAGGEAYSAWAWAVNGFFSVIGSVLTTILAMEFGFRFVQFLAVGVYAVAVLAFTRLERTCVDR